MDTIQDILTSVIGNISSKNVEHHEKLERVWKNVLSEQEQYHTQLIGSKEGKISAYVDSSAWLYHMNMRKRRIMKDIKEEIPESISVYFKIGKVTTKSSDQ